MKTTVQIPDSLLGEARKLARQRHTTLKALIEEGLRRLISEHKSQRGQFRLRDAGFKGKGLQPEFEGANWETIRTTIYEGRGG